jgi:hypothetical protein
MAMKPSVPPERVAQSGAIKLASLLSKKGRFQYRYDAATGERRGGYNILRHCGAIWSMADAASEIRKPVKLSAGCGQALDCLFREYLRHPGAIDARCVVEKGMVKLGGNGLAILAILACHRLSADESILDVARSLGRYIVGQLRPDRDFHHKRSFPDGKLQEFRSGYYTGEALFALAALYETTSEREWLDTALESELALAGRGYGIEEQSHWCLYAIDKMHQFEPLPELYEHARKIVEHIIEFPDYRARRQSTPTACRSEGMLAFLRTARRAGVAQDRAFRDRCLAEIEENLGLQLQFRRPDGAFVQGDGKTLVRIDFIQHNLSSFLDYHRLMRDGGV